MGVKININTRRCNGQRQTCVAAVMFIGDQGYLRSFHVPYIPHHYRAAKIKITAFYTEAVADTEWALANCFMLGIVLPLLGSCLQIDQDIV